MIRMDTSFASSGLPGRSARDVLSHRSSPRPRVCYTWITSTFCWEAVMLAAFGCVCGSGEIGRHTILRGWRRKAWGFKSPLPHQCIHSEEFRTFDSMLIILVTIIHVIVCLFLIVVVLLQSGKAGDISAAFGGQGSQAAFGPRGAATALSKATTISAVLFMLTSVTLSIYATKHGGGATSVLQGVKSAPVKSQPAAPAQAPASSPMQK